VGLHNFTFFAIDADNDRPNDSLNYTIIVYINITDDDTDPPNILINYEGGDGTDGNPGNFSWIIYDINDAILGDNDTGLSEIIIKVYFESNEDLPDEVYILTPNDNGTWGLPSYPGKYTITIFARDNDDDRTLILDSLFTELIREQDLIDDDTHPPRIQINYSSGDGTDGNPGYFSWVITDEDDKIGGDNDTGLSEIFVKVIFESSEGLPNKEYILVDPNEMGTWNLPSFLGKYTITVFARDNDDDGTLIVDSLSAELLSDETIVDDDIINPDINYEYIGDGTDGNPGEIVVFASDASGLSVDPSGIYSVPNSLGTHVFIFNATDADNDRIGDSLNFTLTVIINITDDDTILPEINYTYTGYGTDGNPGEIVISASDNSGLSIDPSGIYSVPSSLGTHVFIFNATDGDNDRPDDSLNSSITVLITITDDDITSPEISYEYTGEGTDGNPGEIVVSASDVSGLSVDPSGTYSVPNTLGTYIFIFNATDADDDRLGDNLNSTIQVLINITDDDITSPEISYEYTGDGTDGNPGKIIVNASDTSGLFIDPSGIYNVPNNLGTHVFIFNATDADNDRLGDSLNFTLTVIINITDDDITLPEINYIYTGDGTDGNPGEIVVFASDTSGLSVDPSGNYTVPTQPGNYKFIFNASDADNDRTNDTLNFSLIVWIIIIDDDIDEPVLEDIFYEEYIFDSDVFIPVEINASDKSGIKKIIIEFQGEIYESYIENNTYYFALRNPIELGNYSFIVLIEDADDDRLDDSLTSDFEYSFKIIDDDTTAPVINKVLIDNPVYNNASFFLVGVNVTDFSGIEIVQIEFMGKIYNLTEANGLYYKSIPMPFKIGNYSLIVMATDADVDRNFDALTSIKNFTVVIAKGMNTDINITIDFLGFSLNRNLGIDITFMISANIEAGTEYTVIIQFSNGSILYTYNELGTISPTVYELNNYTVMVKLNISGIIYEANMTIELAEEHIKELIYRELDIMRQMVIDSSYKDWRGWARLKKLIILFELDIVEFLAENNLDRCAYIVMLGIKVELTGSFTDENGESFNDWRCCPFVQAWIKDDELREEFLIECNMILWALTLCFE
jgi:hypothetical protein